MKADDLRKTKLIADDIVCRLRFETSAIPSFFLALVMI